MPKKILGSVLISLLSLVTFLTSSDEPFCKQVANYTMNVVLDTERKIITGEEFLTWTNDSEYPTDELWFHLYWNAFKNNMSTFLTEAGRRGRDMAGFEMTDWGYCRVDSIHLIDEENFAEIDLSPTMAFQQPDNDNTHDQTVFLVKLPQPVEPGQTIELRIAFLSKVPRPISRTGVYKDNYFIAVPERAFLDIVYLNKDYHFDNLSVLNWNKVFEILAIYGGNKRMEKKVKEYYKNFSISRG